MFKKILNLGNNNKSSKNKHHSHSHCQQQQVSQIFPSHVISESQKNKCYLIVRNDHYSVVFDIKGESNQEYITGIETHVVQHKRGDKSTVNLKGFRTQLKKEGLKIINLGVLQPSRISEQRDKDEITSLEFFHWSMVRFNSEYINDGGGEWSRKFNCQTYSQFLVKELGFQWPSDVDILTEPFNCPFE